MSAKTTRPAEDAAAREIVITRVFDAPRELVWEAWTNPHHVAQWWGPRGFSTTIEKMEVRPGGVWQQVMHGPDGTDYPNKSTFTEVTKPERIVYTHSGGRKGAPGVTFEATWTFDVVDDDHTRLTVRMVFPTAEAREVVAKEYGAIEGGVQTLGRLAELLGRTPVVVERTFAAPTATVWKAITNLEQMKKWYFDTLAAFQPSVGFETRFNVRQGDKTYVHLWKVTAVTAGKMISYSWKFEGFPGESLLTFELFPDGEKTRLKLTHAGLETFDPERHPELSRGNFLKGWTQIIGLSLLAYLEKIASPAGAEFVLTRVFDAPRDLVWKAWTEREHLQKWFGPKGVTIAKCELDLRPGGIFHYCMKTPDGHEMWGKWTFREIVPPEKLVVIVSFSDAQGGVTRHPLSAAWPLETLSTTTFAEHDGKTTMTLRWAPYNATDAEQQAFDSGRPGMTQGWGGTMEQLTAYLAKIAKRPSLGAR